MSRHLYTFLRLILSGEMMEVLAEREVVLEEGRETAAVTAVAIVVRLNKEWDEEKKEVLGRKEGGD